MSNKLNAVEEVLVAGLKIALAPVLIVEYICAPPPGKSADEIKLEKDVETRVYEKLVNSLADEKIKEHQGK